MRNGQRVGPKTGSHSSPTCLAGVEEDRNKKKRPPQKKQKRKRKKKETQPAFSLFRFFPLHCYRGYICDVWEGVLYKQRVVLFFQQIVWMYKEASKWI